MNFPPEVKYHLQRVLICLNINNPKLSTFFVPPPNRPFLEALYDHLLGLHQAFADDLARWIVAAGLLALGDLSCVDEILENLPTVPIPRDHGAGWCVIIPYSTVAAVLPLPADCMETDKWITGSYEALTVKKWVAENRQRLTWDPIEQVYRMSLDAYT